MAAGDVERQRIAPILQQNGFADFWLSRFGALEIRYGKEQVRPGAK